MQYNANMTEIDFFEKRIMASEFGQLGEWREFTVGAALHGSVTTVRLGFGGITSLDGVVISVDDVSGKFIVPETVERQLETRRKCQHICAETCTSFHMCPPCEPAMVQNGVFNTGKWCPFDCHCRDVGAVDDACNPMNLQDCLGTQMRYRGDYFRVGDGICDDGFCDRDGQCALHWNCPEYDCDGWDCVADALKVFQCEAWRGSYEANIIEGKAFVKPGEEVITTCDPWLDMNCHAYDLEQDAAGAVLANGGMSVSILLLWLSCVACVGITAPFSRM